MNIYQLFQMLYRFLFLINSKFINNFHQILLKIIYLMHLLYFHLQFLQALYIIVILINKLMVYDDLLFFVNLLVLYLQLFF